MNCADCNTDVPEAVLGAGAIAKGNSVREPGEVLCPGCTSSRVMLVRKVMKMPTQLSMINDRKRVGWQM